MNIKFWNYNEKDYIEFITNLVSWHKLFRQEGVDNGETPKTTKHMLRHIYVLSEIAHHHLANNFIDLFLQCYTTAQVQCAFLTGCTNIFDDEANTKLQVLMQEKEGLINEFCDTVAKQPQSSLHLRKRQLFLYVRMFQGFQALRQFRRGNSVNDADSEKVKHLLLLNLTKAFTDVHNVVVKLLLIKQQCLAEWTTCVLAQNIYDFGSAQIGALNEADSKSSDLIVGNFPSDLEWTRTTVVVNVHEKLFRLYKDFMFMDGFLSFSTLLFLQGCYVSNENKQQLCSLLKLAVDVNRAKTFPSLAADLILSRIDYAHYQYLSDAFEKTDFLDANILKVAAKFRVVFTLINNTSSVYMWQQKREGVVNKLKAVQIEKEQLTSKLQEIIINDIYSIKNQDEKQQDLNDEDNKTKHNLLLLRLLEHVNAEEVRVQFCISEYDQGRIVLRNPNVVNSSQQQQQQQQEAKKKKVLPQVSLKSNVQVCANCKKPNPQKKCSACKQACYCSQECQVNHWAEHKKVCKK